MGYASITFPGKPDLALQFRIDPNSIDWNFEVHTNVINTVGGRVVQIVGATLSDLTVKGDLGEDRSLQDGTVNPPGRSWRLAVAFAEKIRQIMTYQAIDSTNPSLMHPTAKFSYPPLQIDMDVYLKSLKDPDGGVVTLSPGKFSHSYVLTMMVVQNGSDAVITNKAATAAANQYIQRISNGIGWVPNSYAGNFGDYYKGQYDTTQSTTVGDSQESAFAADPSGFLQTYNYAAAGTTPPGGSS